MAMPCSVCVHAEREAIDKALAAAATTNRIAAKRFGLSAAAVQRHRTGHLLPTLAAASTARNLANGNALLAEVERYRKRGEKLLKKAEDGNDLRAAASLLRELRGFVELLGRLMGELKERDLTLNVVNVSPEVAERMARVYLERRAEAPALPASGKVE